MVLMRLTSPGVLEGFHMRFIGLRVVCLQIIPARYVQREELWKVNVTQMFFTRIEDLNL